MKWSLNLISFFTFYTSNQVHRDRLYSSNLRLSKYWNTLYWAKKWSHIFWLSITCYILSLNLEEFSHIDHWILGLTRLFFNIRQSYLDVNFNHFKSWMETELRQLNKSQLYVSTFDVVRIRLYVRKVCHHTNLRHSHHSIFLCCNTHTVPSEKCSDKFISTTTKMIVQGVP